MDCILSHSLILHIDIPIMEETGLPLHLRESKFTEFRALPMVLHDHTPSGDAPGFDDGFHIESGLFGLMVDGADGVRVVDGFTEHGIEVDDVI